VSLVNNTHNKVYLGWHDIDSMVELLAEAVVDHFKSGTVKHIHGLERGGMIPAVMLSHALGIPYTSNPEYFEPEHVLIVDDISDSGATLSRYVYERHPTAVLHHKPHTSICEPDLCAVVHESDAWIIYPWEAKDSKTIQDYKLDI